MRQVIVTVALALGWLAVPTDAYSCTCVSLSPGPTPAELTRQVREQLGKARAVFIGEPVASNALMYRLRVQAVWKGDLGPEVVMASGAEATAEGLIASSSCNVNFRAGERYLIFAYGESHLQMTARHCDLTSQLEFGDATLRVLDRIQPRRRPNPSIAADRVVAVVGNVRKPGLIPWRAGMAVADAIEAAGGVVPRVHDYIPGLSSSVTRGASPDLREEFSPTTLLQPGDQVSVVGPRTIHPHAEL